MAPEPPHADRRTLTIEAGAVFAAFATLYLLTLAGTHNEGGDGVGYVAQIRSGDAALIFNPYHLAYNWLGWAAYHVARLGGYGGGPLGPVQVMNALLGAAGLAVLWAVMRAATHGRLAAIAACGLVGVSAGYWAYAVDAELYTLDALLLILLLAAAWRAADAPSAKRFAVAGAANGAAILGHNTAVLWAFVVLVILWGAHRQLPRGGLARAAAGYAAGALLVVVPAYALAVPAVGLYTPREYYDWLTGYAQSGSYGHWQASTPLRVALGAGRAVIGGHSALAIDPVHRFVAQHFGDKSLRKEFYLVRHVTSAEAWLLLAVSVVAGLLVLLLAARWLQRPSLAPRTRSLAVVAAAWLAPYAVFFAWWQPENAKFWIAGWVPAAVLLALPLGAAPVRPMRPPRFVANALGAGLAALFTVNLLGTVLLYRAKGNDYWRVRVAWYEQHTRPGDLVFANDYVYVEYLNYFSRARAYDLGNDIIGRVGPERAPAEIQRLIDAAPGSRVYFSSELFYPGQDPYSTCSEPICSTGEAVRRAFQPRSLEVANSPLERVWQLQR